MPSEPVAKYRQHHVWQEYLRSWTRSGGIYCLQEGRIFRTGTSALGVIQDFYRLPEWSLDDLRILQDAFMTGISPLVRKLHSTVLENPFMLTLLAADPATAQLVSDEQVSVFRTNVVDDYHTMIESQFLPILPRLLDGDVSWYQNVEECLSFLVFICVQYMRTRSRKERSIQDVTLVDLTRVWDVVAILMAQRVACSLFAERRIRVPRIIGNDSGKPFITGDQPVINLRGGKRGAEPDAFSLYYPLSPELAVYLGEPGEPAGGVLVEPITASAVQDLNSRIARESHSQIFAHAEEPLLLVQNGIDPIGHLGQGRGV
jgi:hypothetical protein